MGKDGHYIYHKHPESQDSSQFAPSDNLRNHLLMYDEPNEGSFHDVTAKKKANRSIRSI